MYKKEKMDPYEGKLICITNSIFLVLISALITYFFFYGEQFVGVGFIGSIIFYYINKWNFVKTQEEFEDENISDNQNFYSNKNKEKNTKLSELMKTKMENNVVVKNYKERFFPINRRKNI